MLGDFRQLPPVGDSAIYNKKSGGKWIAGYNLYQHFTNVVTFSKIQRQDGNLQKEFRAQLERLGDGQFKRTDWEQWKKRSLHQLDHASKLEFQQTATKACALKKDMATYNIERIKAIGQPVAPIPAENDCSEAKGIRGDNESGLPSHLLLCKGAKIRLRSNLWTAAGLVNGAVGHVHSIIYDQGKKPPQIPRAIIATFDGYIGPSYLPNVPKAVPIVPARRTWISRGRKTCNRKQLPVILSYALSIHMLQGATEKKVLLNAGPVEFCQGLLLVGSTRTKAIEDLAFDPMPPFHRFEKINKSQEVKRRRAEEDRMAKLEGMTFQKNKAIISDCFHRYGRASGPTPRPKRQAPAPPKGPVAGTSRPQRPAPAPPGPVPPQTSGLTTRPKRPAPAPPRGPVSRK